MSKEQDYLNKAIYDSESSIPLENKDKKKVDIKKKKLGYDENVIDKVLKKGSDINKDLKKKIKKIDLFKKKKNITFFNKL